MDKLTVLYSASDLYAPIAGVSIYSLLKNNHTFEKIHINMVSNNISEENIEKLRKTVEGYGHTIEFIDSKQIDKILEKNGVSRFRGSYATFQKIYINQFLNKEEKYLLYIDSDTIIETDLGGIFDGIEKSKFPISIVRVPMYRSYNRLIGDSCDEIYPNCGIILFDWEAWQEKRCEEKVDAFLKKNGEREFRAADQDIISIVFGEQMNVLPPRYNVGAAWAFHGAENFMKIHEASAENFYAIEEVEKALEEPAILHCLGGFYGRPWEKGNQHPFKERWRYYLEQSLWADFNLLEMKKTKMFDLQKGMYNYLPKRVYVFLHRNMMKLQCIKCRERKRNDKD